MYYFIHVRTISCVVVRECWKKVKKLSVSGNWIVFFIFIFFNRIEIKCRWKFYMLLIQKVEWKKNLVCYECDLHPTTMLDCIHKFTWNRRKKCRNICRVLLLLLLLHRMEQPIYTFFSMFKQQNRFVLFFNIAILYFYFCLFDMKWIQHTQVYMLLLNLMRYNRNE